MVSLFLTAAHLWTILDAFTLPLVLELLCTASNVQIVYVTFLSVSWKNNEA